MKHVLAAVLCKSNNCHPEAEGSHAQASDSQRRTSVLLDESKNRVPHFSRSVREVG
jgi:hypothetical protein